jgi:hypothetical protein
MKAFNHLLCARILAVAAATDNVTPDKVEADIKQDQ